MCRRIGQQPGLHESKTIRTGDAVLNWTRDGGSFDLELVKFRRIRPHGQRGRSGQDPVECVPEAKAGG